MNANLNRCKTISPLNPFLNVVIPWNSSVAYKLQKQIIRVDGAEKTTSAEKKDVQRVANNITCNSENTLWIGF